MGYFPFFVDLNGMPGLIVGGGTVALRKIEKLLPFGPKLTVVSPELCPEIRYMGELKIIERRFRPLDLYGMEFAVACTNCPSLDRRIAGMCRVQRIPVNVVDDPRYCSFFFPALVRRGSLSIGISTSGASPTAAAYLKEKVSGAIPERFDEVLEYLGSLRPGLKARFPEERRPAIFKGLFEECMSLGRPTTEAELEEYLADFRKEGGN